jgi:hypothetical protein
LPSNFLVLPSNFLVLPSGFLGVSDVLQEAQGKWLGILRESLGVLSKCLDVLRKWPGMTNQGLGMTNQGLGMTNQGLGMTNRGLGMTESNQPLHPSWYHDKLCPSANLPPDPPPCPLRPRSAKPSPAQRASRLLRRP